MENQNPITNTAKEVWQVAYSKWVAKDPEAKYPARVSASVVNRYDHLTCNCKLYDRPEHTIADMMQCETAQCVCGAAAFLECEKDGAPMAIDGRAAMAKWMNGGAYVMCKHCCRIYGLKYARAHNGAAVVTCLELTREGHKSMAIELPQSESVALAYSILAHARQALRAEQHAIALKWAHANQTAVPTDNELVWGEEDSRTKCSKCNVTAKHKLDLEVDGTRRTIATYCTACRHTEVYYVEDE